MTQGLPACLLDVRDNMVLNARYQFVLLYTVGDAALLAAAEDDTLLLRFRLPTG